VEHEEAAMNTDSPTRVIVGVHNSLAGLRALRWGVTESRRLDATLHVVRAWRPTAYERGMGLAGWRDIGDQAAAATVLDAFAAAMGAPPTDMRVLVVTMPGPPGPALVGYADRPDDLLIVGACERPLAHRMLGGSVARYCMAHAACPVLAIPPRTPGRAGRLRALTRAVQREAEELTHLAGGF
jgi:nucleotide-binding universal stress UspA family protein